MAMMKRIILLLAMLAVVMLVIAGCGAEQEQMDPDDAPISITVVTEIPAGYSHMRELSKQYAGIITFEELEGSLIFVNDVEGNHIWTTLANEKDKIVMYEDMYYIRDSEIEAIIDKAKRTAEIKEWDYEIGDGVELFGGKRWLMYITVEELQYRTDDATGQRICRALFSFEVIDSGEFSAADCLYSFEFSDGSTSREMIPIDGYTVDVAVPENCHICKIILCSPENNAMQRPVACCTEEQHRP